MDEPSTSAGSLARLRWQVLHTRNGQAAGTAALLALAFLSPFLAFNLPEPVLLQPLRILLVALPSLLTLLALALVAAAFVGPGRWALLVGLAVYLLIGVLVTLLSDPGELPGREWLLFTWPTSLLLDAGFDRQWWPDPGE